MTSKRLKWWIGIPATLGLMVVAVWIWDGLAFNREAAAPDHFDLGTVQSGSTLEISARFLTVPGRSLLGRFYEAVLHAAPASWHSTLSKFNPKRKVTPAPMLPDLSVLKPQIETPSFVRVTRVTPMQRANWYNGRPFFVLEMEVNTDVPGPWSGQVLLRLDRRQAALPIRLTVAENKAATRRLLIAQTPYQASATEDGSMFNTTAEALARTGMRMDCRNKLPEDLGSYDSVLLAEAVLAVMNDHNVERIRQYASQGGRVILACNAFMRGTVETSNKILAGHGLEVVDKDYGREVTVTNLAADPLVRGVRRLVYFRPSLVRVVDAEKARALALAPGGEGGLIAVSRLEGGGELVVLGISMWWGWMHNYAGNSDNIRMMLNLLTGAAENLAEGP